MVKSPYEYFAALLGIRSPWFIQQVLLSKDTRRIQFHLGYAETQSDLALNLQSIHQPHFAAHPQIARWAHRRLGVYQCYISSMIYAPRDPATKAPGISQEALLLPHFLGEAGRYYTQGLRQQVAQLHLRGLSIDAITHALGLERHLIHSLVVDIEATPSTYRAVCALPCASESLWENLIRHPASLHTELFALRLLMSKLKPAAQDSGKLALATQELRQFFIVNHAQLAGELTQLHGLPLTNATSADTPTTSSHASAMHSLSAVKKPQAPAITAAAVMATTFSATPLATAFTTASATTAQSRTKLVLPSLKNSIWLKLITGKLQLPTHNLSLRLQLTRLGHVFQQARHSDDRLMALKALREYMKTHARLLKPELRFINQLLDPAPTEAPATKQAQTQVPSPTLPDEQHRVWQSILGNERPINSNYMAYKLLLASLRRQLFSNPSPATQLQAARTLRNFIQQNQRFMPQELRQVLHHAQAG